MIISWQELGFYNLHGFVGDPTWFSFASVPWERGTLCVDRTSSLCGAQILTNLIVAHSNPSQIIIF